MRATASPQPKPIAYFEVPIVGDGSVENPFRVQMPEEIVTDPKLGKRNLLALTHSALIKTDRATGKPIEYTALVRVFEQPDRDVALRPISACLDALRAMAGVRELTREQAIARAKQLDPDLTDADLLPIPSTAPDFKTRLEDYIAHREGLGVKRELIDDKLMESYLQEDKSW